MGNVFLCNANLSGGGNQASLAKINQPGSPYVWPSYNDMNNDIVPERLEEHWTALFNKLQRPKRYRTSRTGLSKWALAISLVAQLNNCFIDAKESTMAGKEYTYYPYIVGMELPEGVFPPMQGYTHGDLIAAAQARVEALMLKKSIDPTLIRESLIALATHLNDAFEKEGVEYQISSWYQKAYLDSAARSRSIKHMGEDFGGAAVDAAGDSLRGSPLLLQGKDFFGDYIEAAGDAVHDLIVTLNADKI